ncbi:transcription factor ILR3-like isoform X2 [Zingiber officinale]|uniref:transcription factor ILR3-like isoform X2 n=1 Tax=Zingiber officinale TaxID=94328 RepID=UPI001C4B21FA|nr:transcription factor ILR3-like isoform X2 [Zingiber officinale]
MGSTENPNWFLESLIDDIPVSEGDFAGTNGGFYWTAQGFNSSSSVSSFANSGSIKEPVNGKRLTAARSETCAKPATKACREKMRRDKLNDRFMELAYLLEPGKQAKTDKSAILSEATCMLTQLRNEVQKLKELNGTLEEKTKEFKAEKNELREEKQKLKAEKESLEQQIKLLNTRSSIYAAHPPVIPTPFTVPGQPAGHKLIMPIIGYPSYPMWQFMPPADVDISLDADKWPPVA